VRAGGEEKEEGEGWSKMNGCVVSQALISQFPNLPSGGDKWGMEPPGETSTQLLPPLSQR
jgi:hypothetical protein